MKKKTQKRIKKNGRSKDGKYLRKEELDEKKKKKKKPNNKAK